MLSARHEIDYLNEKYGWDIPQGDYDTLGGLIIHVTARIPDLNATVELSPFTFTIVALEDTRIGAVKVAINKSVNGSSTYVLEPRLHWCFNAPNQRLAH